MRLFRKIEKENGRKNIYFCGIKIFSYKSLSKFKKSKYFSKNYIDKFNKGGYKLYKKNDKICIEGNNLYLEGDAENTIWTAEAVLLNDEYNLKSTEEFIMIDIGLNIGLTSVYLSRSENIKSIYAFEPFKETYSLAQRNINFNECSKNKVQAYNFGLGDTNKELNIHYNRDLCGSMSSIKDRFKNYKKIEKIQIKDASEILEPILLRHKEKVFLKIDCEGAEIEIIPNLDNSGLLQKIDFLIMEWHFEYPDKLIEILNRNNFIVFCNIAQHDELGIIRAVRVSK